MRIKRLNERPAARIKKVVSVIKLYNVSKEIIEKK